MQRLAWLLATFALCAAIASADRVFHEQVPHLGEDEGTSVVHGPNTEPAALVHGGEVIPAPSGGALTANERAVRARDPEHGQAPSFRPDRVTALEGSIGYFEVFTPAISPFKRVTALDRVTITREGIPVLASTEGSPRAQVPVEGTGARAPDGRERDAFWGSVVLDFTDGRIVPLPSVSPESRILTMRTEPSVALHVERDAADNFFAVLNEGSPRGEVRLVFLTDAPRTYFGTDLPAGRADSLSHEVAPLPPALELRALEFARTLGIDRGAAFDVALSRLTEHFRSFEESREPPNDSGDIYWDLATGMKGVCRHRAYGFVITAQALGIPARFVQNEAHAWVEVHLPQGFGWIRVDLGGSPRGLRPHTPSDAPNYRSAVPDPLPRPEPYLRAYAEASARAGGDPSSDSEAGANAASRREQDETDPPAGDRPSGTASVSSGRVGDREPLEISVDIASRVSVRRGETLTVSGRANTESANLREGLRIEVLLHPIHSGEDRLLGVTVTHEHGVFVGSFGVPPDLSVGDYRLVVRSPGNTRVAPAIAR